MGLEGRMNSTIGIPNGANKRHLSNVKHSSNQQGADNNIDAQLILPGGGTYTYVSGVH